MGREMDNIKVNQRYIECKGICLILLVQIKTNGHVSDIWHWIFGFSCCSIVCYVLWHISRFCFLLISLYNISLLVREMKGRYLWIGTCYFCINIAC